VLVHCTGCTTPYPDELAKCPNCEATERQANMPKISREGGPSVAGDPDQSPPNERTADDQDTATERANEGVTAEQGKSALTPNPSAPARDSDTGATATRKGSTTTGR
jgi:hypothetical protein